jgi:hypothetical protein
VIHGARADNRCSDRRVAQDEADSHIDQADPGLVGELAELVGGIELALVSRGAHVEARARPGRRGRRGGSVFAVPAGEPAASGL